MTSSPPLDEYRLTIEGSDATWRVFRAVRTERVHAPFAFQLTCVAEDRAGDAKAVDERALVAANASLTIEPHERTTRVVEGVIDSIESVPQGFTLTLVPRIAVLADAVDHRVFIERDALEIIGMVLEEHGLTLDKRVTRRLPKRPQCVQAFESDLSFVSRLCSEEGITWYLPADVADKAVFSDSPAGFDDHPELPELPVRAPSGLKTDESVFEARVEKTVVVDRVALGDFDFEKPNFDLMVKTRGAGTRERFEFPGGYADPSVGGELAKIRLEQHGGTRTLLRAKTTSRRLVPGYVMTLYDPERPVVSGRWLVLEVREVVAQPSASLEGRHHQAEFVALPAEDGYRAPRVAAPSLGGVQTATVTGASGAEVAPDGHGRVTVLHRWDRQNKNDDTSSSPQRVVQPPLSGGFMQPRVGWEVLLGFRGVSGDQPFVLGRMANALAPPPSALPGKKIVSALGSSTSPGGGSANVIETDDSAGNEAMNFTASNDWNERTENDKNTAITANESWSVAADRKLIVGQVLSTKVSGAQSYTVGADRTANVTSNVIVNAASESVTIGGLRTFSVGGDYRASSASLTRVVGAAKAEAAIESSGRAVKGPSTVLVGASWETVAGASANVSVLGASTEVVGGQKSIKASRVAVNVKGVLNETLASRTVVAGADRVESFGAAGSYDISGAATLQGSDITVTAKSKITIEAGGVTVEITPSSITISGDVKSSTENEDKGEAHYG